MPILEAARAVNAQQRELVVQKLLSVLKTIQGRTVCLLGLAFKEDTDDLRDAPSLEIARRLRELGALVQAHDPIAMPKARRDEGNRGIRFCETVGLAAKDADALVLVTPWPEYRNVSWPCLAAIMRRALVLDARNFLDRDAVERGGFQYLGIGR
jgi:UDPglucose 6-dehydrogenase